VSLDEQGGGQWENALVLLVRPARPEDGEAVADLHVRSWQVAYRGLLPDHYLDGLRPEDRMGRYSFGSDDPAAPSTFVATEHDAMRGFVTTGPSRDLDAPGAGELLALYVDPLAWGLGVGRCLMEHARAQLHETGFRHATLWVLVGNDRAQRFYRADGWLPDGVRRTQDVWGVAVDEERLHRTLS
jgi:ribosomal protein S18 acetylase RimI-like enzyme